MFYNNYEELARAHYMKWRNKNNGIRFYLNNPGGRNNNYKRGSRTYVQEWTYYKAGYLSPNVKLLLQCNII